MKPRISRFRVGALAMMLAVMTGGAALAHTDITAEEAHDMIASGEDLIVVDVREYSEFCGSKEHIEDAVNLPWNSDVLETRFAEVPADAKIIVVCASGGRSNLAANFLDGEGYTRVHDMQGGMNGWPYDTEACDASPFLLMRKIESGAVINWTPVSGTQNYDLVRGLVSNVSDGGTDIYLGPTDCLATESPYTYQADEDVPLSESVHFYLSRQIGGSLGQSSESQERVDTCD